MVIDGCPPRLELSEADLQRDLDRRRPGQSDIVTPRNEADCCRILSGVFEGRTLGTPIAVLVPNTDAVPEAYTEMETAFRPSHADFTYQAKYGVRNWQGGGRSSARETIGRVAAGRGGENRPARVAGRGWKSSPTSAAFIRLEAQIDPATVRAEEVDANPVRCPDAEVAAEDGRR